MVFGIWSYKCHEIYAFRLTAPWFSAKLRLLRLILAISGTRQPKCWKWCCRDSFWPYLVPGSQIYAFRLTAPWFSACKTKNLRNQSSRVLSQESMKKHVFYHKFHFVHVRSHGSSTFYGRLLETLKRELRRKDTNKLGSFFLKSRFHANPL